MGSTRDRFWQITMWAACLPIAALLWTAGLAPAQDAGKWIESPGSHYTLFSQAGYQKDVEFARAVLESGDALLLKKYGVTLAKYHLDVYLYPEPNERAGTGMANLHCCSPHGAVGAGTIALLAPSAPAWKGFHGQTSLRLPKDENYQAKVLMSEYITVGHYAVQDSRTKPGGWRYYSAPQWFVQGLQEYDGIFHTTEANRDITAAALKAWAKAHPEAFTCCDWGLQISDVYNGGAAFLTFLAAEFGEDIHARLLRDDAPTFPEAFARETKPYPLQELFVKFRAWLKA